MTDAAAAEVVVNLGTFNGEDARTLEHAVRAVLASEHAAPAEFSLTLLDDEGIRALNARYLGKDHPTDVIAFSLGTDAHPLGDVYIGADQARRQAEELGVPVNEELVRLAVHGTLHVLGHDHPDGPERMNSPMFQLQERLVRAMLGVDS